MPLISTLGEAEADKCEFEIRLVCIESSRPASTTSGDIVLNLKNYASEVCFGNVFALLA